MSTKNNALISAAATALGLVVVGGVSPVCEGLMNDLSVTGFGVAEVDASGRCMVIASIYDGTNTTVRPVADAGGNVRLYGDVNSAMALAKRANVAEGTQLKFVKFAAVVSVGDPVVALKQKYKRFKAEKISSTKQTNTITGKIAAAVALGWDIATGTPENAEYLDLSARSVSIAEWHAFNSDKVTTLAAALTAAGVDPATVI